MNKEFKNIVSVIDNYLTLKDNYKEYNQENLYDVFEIFSNELFELSEIVYKIDKVLDKIIRDELRYIDDSVIKEIINKEEENLVNEIADVLLTSARLIHEFNLQEALSEMIEYKYERQKSRELKRFKNTKNELLK